MDVFRKVALKGVAVLAALSMAVLGAAEFTEEKLKAMVTELSVHLPQYPGYTYPVKASLEKNEKINAYATVERIEGEEKPQAVMVVFTGLVDFFEGEEALIRAVVAHELAHLSKGHPTSGGYKVGEVQTVFIRQLELEADAVGAGCLAEAGYSKDDMIRVLMKLDELGKNSGLMHQIGADHPTGATRASVVADNPLVYRSLADFQLGNAFMQNRRYVQAISAYERAVVKEPNFPEAYINLAQAKLMDYYDKLPQSTKEAWFRPDFGPVLLETGVGSRALDISAADRRRFTEAVAAINLAIEKAPANGRAQELKALALVLDPEGQGANLSEGITMYREMIRSAMTGADVLRYSNNLAIGLQRQSDVRGAVAVMMEAQEKSPLFNRYLAQNLGAKGLEYVSDDAIALALGVVYAWLQNTPSSHEDYTQLRDAYVNTCAARKFEAREVKPLPTYLCQATTITIRGGEISFMEPVMSVVERFGKAQKAWKFNDDFPDILEYRWDAEQFHVVSDRDAIFRLTSYDPGSFLTLKPLNDTVQTEFQVTVGMSKADFAKILNPENGVKISLVRSGTVEEWLYFPGVMMGVCIDGDKVVGITVTPAEVP